MKIIITIEVDDENNVNVVTETEKIEKEDRKNDEGFSIYARYFDEGCVGWTKDSEYNLCFLKQQQVYCNDMLKFKGHLFLNEVYDILGIPRTRAGQLAGWIYDEANPIGVNFVDFGLYSDRNKDFINGIDRVALLEFNVCENILDKI